MERASKKSWYGPELIVLVRSRPEEAVLSTCKLATSGTAVGATTTVSQCRTYVSWRGCTTTQCSTRTGS